IGWKIAANYDSVQVHGTGGSVLANPLEVEVRHGNYGALERVADHIKQSHKVVSSQIRSMSGGTRPHYTYFREDRAFIDAAIKGGNPLVSGEDGLFVLEVLEGIKESLEREKFVRVKHHEKI
ncbi:MAG: Gfo/Idh/MocA family oxidoreductase, partial [Thermotogota bacterium]|nr:Gfo/Idh/MocA family oxidoreductase [Thermotogota bacterium]